MIYSLVCLSRLTANLRCDGFKKRNKNNTFKIIINPLRYLKWITLQSRIIRPNFRLEIIIKVQLSYVPIKSNDCFLKAHTQKDAQSIYFYFFCSTKNNYSNKIAIIVFGLGSFLSIFQEKLKSSIIHVARFM